MRQGYNTWPQIDAKLQPDRVKMNRMCKSRSTRPERDKQKSARVKRDADYWRSTMGMGGAMDSCGRCMKFCLICLNIVTFIGGAVVVGIGGWVWSGRSFSSSLLNSNLYVASMAAVVVTGAAIMLLSLLGCCGAAKEVKCMLLTKVYFGNASNIATSSLAMSGTINPLMGDSCRYSRIMRNSMVTRYYILVFIIFVIMLVGGILQFVFREKIKTTLDREMVAAIPYYGVKHEYTTAWDQTQTYLQCCGVKSYTDWNDNLPESCCREIYEGQRLDCRSTQNPSTMYTEGCLTKTINLLREDAVYIGAVAIVVALAMLMALIFSCGLFMKIE